MTTRPIAAPEFEPVTLAQARLAARVDSDDTSDDALFTGVIIPGARQDCEQILQRSLMKQTWRRTLDDFGCGVIQLAWPNLLSVQAVQYRDIDGTWQTLSSSLYEVDVASLPGRVIRALQANWPTVYPLPGSVRVDYTAGYSADATEATQQAAVPASVKRWILARIATAYDHRLELIAGATVSSLPNRFVDSALDRERFYGFCD
jgi:uncharacterized phiE125 gp8 family phage protein